MRLFRTFAISLVTLIAWSGIGNTQAIHTPHAAGTVAPPVNTMSSAVQEEVAAAGASWTRATNNAPVSFGSMLLLTDG